MKPLIQCDICHKQGDKHWAVWHKEHVHAFGDKDEPPSYKVNVGISAGILSADGALARRFKEFRALWSSDWGIPVIRGVLPSRRLLISSDIPKEG